ncbi:MAG TPA: OmpA family protein [Cyclobacteriaceae bacterium]|jgi:outer membrane protein OmpA-like peptidoglycan-associated protein|nr:OmpA family protein [Cyclobacteriaceae bacterium]
MKNLLILSLLLCACTSFGQRRTVNAEDPDFAAVKNMYLEGKFKQAISLLEQMVMSAPDNPDAVFYLASSYYNIGESQKAWERFKFLETLNPNYDPWFYLEAGVAAKDLKDWDESIRLLSQFKKRFPNSANATRARHRADYLINYAKQAKAFALQPAQMKEPVALPSPINSPQGDYLPMLDATGNKLYFTSKRFGGFSKEVDGAKEGDEDLYFTIRTNGTWGDPQLLPAPLNSAGNDGAASFSADGQMMVFGACGRQDGVGGCDLYFSVLEGEQWSKPLNLGNVVNGPEWDAHSTLSADGTKIIFSSNRMGGYGGEDLYLVERNPFGEWGVPSNLGPTINTPLTELSPFLSQDGKTLYFSSNGHPGLGETDIFKSVFENGKWSTPVNLGKPLNTSGDDRYFTIGGSGEKGYISSSKAQGKFQLYEIDIPKDLRPQSSIVVAGVVTNAKTNAPVAANVMVEDIKTGELIATSKSNSSTGKYLVVLPSGRTYSVSASKEGFFFFSQRFDVPTASSFKEIKKDIQLKPIEKGAKVILNNIFFETGKAVLSGESRLELQKAIDLLKKNPSMVIEIGGHTDNIGDDASNNKLSHDRAKSVRDYLISGGIAATRLQSKGYGKMSPVADNNTEDGRQANRRTEFVILEF